MTKMVVETNMRYIVQDLKSERLGNVVEFVDE